MLEENAQFIIDMFIHTSEAAKYGHRLSFHQCATHKTGLDWLVAISDSGKVFFLLNTYTT